MPAASIIESISNDVASDVCGGPSGKERATSWK